MYFNVKAGKYFISIVIMCLMHPFVVASQCSIAIKKGNKIAVIHNADVTKDVQDHLNNLNLKISNYLGFKFNHSYYDDGSRHNAFSSEVNNNIYMGIGLIKECLNKPEGLLCLDFIYCHEAAHLFQYRDKNNHLRRRRTLKYFELQADCLSSKIVSDCLKFKNSDQFGKMLDYVFTIGDYFVRKYQHHGTPLERMISCFVYWNVGDPLSKDILEFYKNSYYLFERKECVECQSINHYDIALEDHGQVSHYAIGIDLNIYNQSDYDGFSKLTHIKGRVVPRKRDKKDNFNFIIYDEHRKMHKSKKYSVIEGIVYSGDNLNLRVGTIHGKL